MHRFFIATHGRRIIVPGEVVSLPEKVAHQVRDVLHLAVGEQLVLLDNSGDELVSIIVRSSRSEVEVEVLERRMGKSESPVHIVLCQGMLKSARFEWLLEKGTELGVSTFAPVVCHRSMSGLESAGSAKLQRWQRIIQEATEQCGRARLPELLPIRSLTHVLNDMPSGDLAIMPWEEAREASLRDALRSIRPKGCQDTPTTMTVVLFIGPEGGLTAEEVRFAQSHGVQAVTLGQRILRAETAALATIATVMYELEGRFSSIESIENDQTAP
jgi:16S rRNA (uracil1498-N3)-methyltransferase